MAFGLIAHALAGGAEGAGKAGVKAFGELMEQEGKLEFERERDRLQTQREQALQALIHANTLERDAGNNAAADKRMDKDIGARKDLETGRQGFEEKMDSTRGARDIEQRKLDREQQSTENRLNRENQLKTTQMHVNATMSAARMQAERANTVYQTGTDGALYAVSPKGGAVPIKDADGKAFKPAKDVTQSALKTADIYQQQAKLYGDMAKTDPMNSKEYAAEAKRYNDLAVSIITGKTPEPTFKPSNERLDNAVLNDLRSGKSLTEVQRNYETLVGPGKLGQLPGFAEAVKAGETKRGSGGPKIEGPPRAGEAPKSDSAPAGPRAETFSGNEDRMFTQAHRALVQQEQGVAKQIAAATGEEQANLMTELSRIQGEKQKLKDQARSKSIVIRD